MSEPVENPRHFAYALVVLILWSGLLLLFFLSGATWRDIVVAVICGMLFTAVWSTLEWTRRLERTLARIDARLTTIESELGKKNS